MLGNKGEKMEYLDYFDSENTNKLGVEERDVVHDKGLWHREVAIWVLNEKGEVLLQKRSSLKKYAPNKYSVCAGHIDSNEEIEVAALRELFEEVGLKVEKEELIPIGVFKLEGVNNNHYKYTYLVKTDYKITEYVLQKEEVAEVKYITISELERMMDNKDESLTFSSKDYARIVLDKVKEICGGEKMDKNKIDRINELAKKANLTEEEKEEQKKLRQEYIDEYKNNLKAQLDNTYIVDENGNKEKIRKKANNMQ